MLGSRKSELGLAHDVGTSDHQDYHLPVIDLLGNRAEAAIGTAVFVACCLALRMAAHHLASPVCGSLPPSCRQLTTSLPVSTLPQTPSRHRRPPNRPIGLAALSCIVCGIPVECRCRWAGAMWGPRSVYKRIADAEFNRIW